MYPREFETNTYTQPTSLHLLYLVKTTIFMAYIVVSTLVISDNY